jgi:hypothetical protein
MSSQANSISLSNSLVLLFVLLEYQLSSPLSGNNGELAKISASISDWLSQGKTVSENE